MGIRLNSRWIEGFSYWGLIRKIREVQRGALQIPPLRFAPVGMIKGRVALPSRFDATEDEEQVPPLRFGRDDMSFLGRIFPTLALLF
jgi:hypothetical protein